MMTIPFKSFWMAGYECADHINKYGDRVDLLSATDHINQLQHDYHLLSTMQIQTVREGIRWSVVEYKPFHYDWTEVAHRILKGISCNIQQLWDICHFGFPDDIHPLHPKFSARFEAICVSFIRLYRSIDPFSHIYITPINEVSFLSWLGGEAAGTSPFCVRQGWEVKYHLMKAYINAIVAMKAIDSRIVIISTEPLVHIVPQQQASYQERLDAFQQREDQFQAMDMLCGYICPELGGRPDLVDIIGVNFYYSNQWVYGTMQSLSWAPHDRHDQWRPLHLLLEEVHSRYGKPVAITETSHPGEDRGIWLSYVAAECDLALERNIPLMGICIYPIIDRPDWDYPNIWHHSGLWDMDEVSGNASQRILFQPMAEVLAASINHLTKKEKTNIAALAQDFL